MTSAGPAGSDPQRDLLDEARRLAEADVDFEDYGSLETLLRNLSTRQNLDEPNDEFNALIQFQGQEIYTLKYSRGSESFRGAMRTKEAKLILIRGFPHQDDLNDVFHTTEIDIALFLRHLHFLASIPDDDDPDPANHHAFHALPRLPSDNMRIFTLQVPSIINNRVPSRDSSPVNLEDQCKQALEKLKTYHENLVSKADAGDSLVRGYHVVTEDVSIVEQTISVGLVKDKGGDWKAVILTDQGRGLDDCASQDGPWESEEAPSVEAARAARQGQQDQGEPELQVPASWPYGSGLDSKDAFGDILHALHGLFRTSAAAQNRVLNLIRREIRHELGISRRKPLQDTTIDNLEYLKSLLEQRIASLKDTEALIDNWGAVERGLMGFKGKEPEESPGQLAKLLLADFSHLRKSAETILADCQIGMEVLARDEALRNAATQSKVTETIGSVASVWPPLMLVASVFGMNFAEIGTLKLWVLGAAVGASILAGLVVAYGWPVVTSGVQSCAKWIGAALVSLWDFLRKQYRRIVPGSSQRESYGCWC